MKGKTVTNWHTKPRRNLLDGFAALALIRFTELVSGHTNTKYLWWQKLYFCRKRRSLCDKDEELRARRGHGNSRWREERRAGCSPWRSAAATPCGARRTAQTRCGFRRRRGDAAAAASTLKAAHILQFPFRLLFLSNSFRAHWTNAIRESLLCSSWNAVRWKFCEHDGGD